MNLTEKLREFEELGPRGGYANLLSLARELHRLLVQAEGALRQAGVAINRVEFPDAKKVVGEALAALHAAGIGG